MGMLDGKVVLITGGARGQGRAHAVASAREGADVVVVDVDVDVGIGSVHYPLGTAAELAQTARLVGEHGRRCLTAIADVRSQDQLDAVVARAIAELGHVDVLIANAGIWTQGLIWELSEQTWQDMIDINLTGVWKSAKAVIPHMIERQTGSIVITSSVNGLEPGFQYGHYASSKHGVIGLMKNIALELAPHGVRCNAISPGAIRTPMVMHQQAFDTFRGAEGGTEADMMAAGYHFHALRGQTFMEPGAIADTALYLNSQLASGVTGVVIPVDAGHLLLTGVNMAPVTE
ncbi:NAD(P)-dependent oxidoreductase [Mycolicibacterium sp. CH28]|uniref:mycofactocin-coupled SDR family oxidoreductase n=1 Tax=Mycolicibacterium sp. CH28 TaxID=2512237 RepID=UPI001081DD13|nr:mycofactocin-coupled SDR family oxidoreductase [Mycolicibacterium sp. CH28]TGD88406.1 NAD(P)-dependent oxidoreductase [Mycolicibacterium sp. CH28]